MSTTTMTTIDEAKASLRANFDKGSKCPCCGQMVKNYGRPIHHSMAYCLLLLYRLTRTRGEGYYHVNEFGADSTIGGDFAKLRYWGLIVEKTKDDSDTVRRTSGFWAITPKGKSFVVGGLKVNKKLFVYDNKITGKSEEFTTIQEALGKKFNYKELMGEYYEEPTGDPVADVVQETLF